MTSKCSKQPNFFQKVFTKNRGFTLVEVMVAAGMLGGLSLVLLNLSSEQVTLEKKAIIAGLVSAYRLGAAETLSSSVACNNTLGGTGVQLSPSTTTSPPFPIPIIKNNRNEDTIYKTGTDLKPDNAFRITRMEINFTIPTTHPPLISGTTDEYWFNPVFVITLNLNTSFMQNYQGVRVRTIRVPLTTRVKKAGSTYTLVTCQANSDLVLEASQVCQLFEGVYDPVGNRCFLAPFVTSRTHICSPSPTVSCTTAWSNTSGVYDPSLWRALSAAPSGPPANPNVHDVRSTAVSVEAMKRYVADQIASLSGQPPISLTTSCSSSSANTVRRTSSNTLEYCDGASWQAISSSSSGFTNCDSSNDGKIRRVGANSYEYCNGGSTPPSWTGLTLSSGTPSNSPFNTCDSTNNGKIYRDPSTGSFKYCNGSSWQTLIFSTTTSDDFWEHQ